MQNFWRRNSAFDIMDRAKPLWASHPFKAIYMAFSLVRIPIHLLWLSAKYSLKPLRPLPEWSLKQNVSAALFRMLFVFWSATWFQRPFFTAPEKVKERLSTVGPPPQSLFKGVLAVSGPIKPAPVDAIWFPSPPWSNKADLAKQKVILHFPGGAFVLAFSHQASGPPITTMLNRHFGADRTVWAQYRLSSTPETRFPGAIQDAVAFYHHVLTLGFDPKNVIISGDSAGGNVAIALLRYFQDHHHPATPLPRGVAVSSPWVHVTTTAAQDYDQYPTSRADVLDGSVLQWGADVYRPEGRLSREVESYISPLHHPFRSSVPLFIQAGTAEGLYEQIKSFAQEMKSIDKNRVLFHSIPLAPHDVLFCHDLFSKSKELEDALDEACQFFEPEH